MSFEMMFEGTNRWWLPDTEWDGIHQKSTDVGNFWQRQLYCISSSQSSAFASNKFNAVEKHL